ncbi:putative formin-like protein 6 isoform X2 [Iris pallida]|uniref:Formin-like protein 6 isoform X2 n=1 Tax=Iris pallida TaxID=29817 RepID=A0AAX6GEB7_IRIPA|nr:putative formin-like protein 6 isoform X2 [Iris pallida]
MIHRLHHGGFPPPSNAAHRRERAAEVIGRLHGAGDCLDIATFILFIFLEIVS